MKKRAFFNIDCVKKIIILGNLLIFMASCIGNKFDPANCSRMAQLVFQWIETLPKADLDYVQVKLIAPDGGTIQTKAGKEGLEIDLINMHYETEYLVVAWEEAGNMVFSGNVVSVNTEIDGMAREPEEFNGGTSVIMIDEKESSPVFTIPLYQQTRPLIVELKFNGPRASQIESVTGMVNGIAGSRYIHHAFFSSAENPRYPAHSSSFIRYEFTPDNQGGYTGQRTLLGISGEDEQRLQLDITLSDKSNLTFEYDITNQIENFYVEEIKQPWVISLTLDIGWDRDDITIVDWKAGPKSVIIVS